MPEFAIWKLRILAAALDARIRAHDLRAVGQRREIGYYRFKARMGFGAAYRWLE